MADNAGVTRWTLAALNLESHRKPLNSFGPYCIPSRPPNTTGNPARLS
jgi:hypothetical protein